MLTYEVSSITSQKVLSLDVFDTALVRTCGAPEALYLWLGRRLHRRGLLDCSPEVFARTRLIAERAVWAREGGLDARVTLADFYQELAPALRFDPGLIDTLITLELALEEAVLRPTLQASDLLHGAERSKLQVVFTSDTYFPAAFIQRQLARNGLWPNHARCFHRPTSECRKPAALFSRPSLTSSEFRRPRSFTSGITSTVMSLRPTASECAVVGLLTVA